MEAGCKAASPARKARTAGQHSFACYAHCNKWVTLPFQFFGRLEKHTYFPFRPLQITPEYHICIAHDFGLLIPIQTCLLGGNHQCNAPSPPQATCAGSVPLQDGLLPPCLECSEVPGRNACRSQGVVEPFTGDVTTTAGLEAALAARTFRCAPASQIIAASTMHLIICRSNVVVLVLQYALLQVRCDLCRGPRAE